MFEDNPYCREVIKLARQVRASMFVHLLSLMRKRPGINHLTALSKLYLIYIQVLEQVLNHARDIMLQCGTMYNEPSTYISRAFIYSMQTIFFESKIPIKVRIINFYHWMIRNCFNIFTFEHI